MLKEIAPGVFWVGKVDWEIREFHGAEYSTHRGTTYNSYFIQDEKNVLIDTVYGVYGREFVDNLRKEGILDRVHFIVANHAEVDHSGALPALMEALPGKPLYCTAQAVKSLRGHFHQDWNFVPVKTGDRLALGRNELIFIEAPLLHWPDSMFCYLTGRNILFPNDAFGQHLATDLLFNDRVDRAELFQEAIKYYANILTPFSPLVEKKISEWASLRLPLSMICPSHGVIWREHPEEIVETYLRWSRAYRENQVTIVYDTMWNGTRRMAEAIARGMGAADPEAVVKIFRISHSDKNDVVTEVFKSRALLVGSPTINRGILSDIAGFLEEVRGLKFQGKRAAAFGTYGWSGESVGMITSKLKEAGFDVVNEGIRAVWNPDEETLLKCEEFGRDFALKTKS